MYRLLNELLGTATSSAVVFEWGFLPILGRAAVPAVILLLGVIKQGLKLGRCLIVCGTVLLTLPYVVELGYQVISLLERIGL